MKPLNEFRNAADRIAEGDLTVEVDVSSKDELGQLAEYFKKMTSNLRNFNWKSAECLIKGCRCSPGTFSIK